MLTLHEVLVEVEGRHATEQELELVHTPEHLARVRDWVAEAERRGSPFAVEPELVVSGATWDASVASVGTALVGIESVLRGDVRSAFCVARPPARDARADGPGRWGFLNAVAVAARYLIATEAVERILLVEWGAAGSSAAALEGITEVRIVSPTAVAPDRFGMDAEGASWFTAERRSGVEAAIAGWSPDFVLLSAGFDWLAGDTTGEGALAPRDVHTASAMLKQVADRECDGRLVSVLDGGYDPALLGQAVVQHLRGLTGLEPAR